MSNTRENEDVVAWALANLPELELTAIVSMADGRAIGEMRIRLSLFQFYVYGCTAKCTLKHENYIEGVIVVLKPAGCGLTNTLLLFFLFLLYFLFFAPHLKGASHWAAGHVGQRTVCGTLRTRGALRAGRCRRGLYRLLCGALYPPPAIRGIAH